MEQLNKTPITGKFGDVAKVLDTNFGLIVTKLMELSEAKGMNCGFYSSETELKTAYPNPDKGMIAYVGRGTDYTVYRCKTDGTWTATSETFKVNISVDLSTYATKDALAQVKGSVDNLLLGAVYGGIASRTTNPGTPKTKVFYLPTEVGEYPNFGYLSVVENEIAFLYYDGTNWTKQSVDFSDNFNEINAELEKKFDKESVAQESGDSDELVMSQKAVSAKFSDLETKAVPFNEQVGAVKARKGDIVTGYSGYHYVDIDISNIRKLRIKGQNSNAAFGYAIFKEDGSYIASEGSTYTSTTFSDIELTFSDEAKRLRFCYFKPTNAVQKINIIEYKNDLLIDKTNLLAKQSFTLGSITDTIIGKFINSSGVLSSNQSYNTKYFAVKKGDKVQVENYVKGNFGNSPISFVLGEEILSFNHYLNIDNSTGYFTAPQDCLCYIPRFNSSDSDKAIINIIHASLVDFTEDIQKGIQQDIDLIKDNSLSLDNRYQYKAVKKISNGILGVGNTLTFADDTFYKAKKGETFLFKDIYNSNITIDLVSIYSDATEESFIKSLYAINGASTQSKQPDVRIEIPQDCFFRISTASNSQKECSLKVYRTVPLYDVVDAINVELNGFKDVYDKEKTIQVPLVAEVGSRTKYYKCSDKCLIVCDDFVNNNNVLRYHTIKDDPTYIQTINIGVRGHFEYTPPQDAKYFSISLTNNLDSETGKVKVIVPSNFYYNKIGETEGTAVKPIVISGDSVAGNLQSKFVSTLINGETAIFGKASGSEGPWSTMMRMGWAPCMVFPFTIPASNKYGVNVDMICNMHYKPTIKEDGTSEFTITDRMTQVDFLVSIWNKTTDNKPYISFGGFDCEINGIQGTLGTSSGVIIDKDGNLVNPDNPSQRLYTIFQRKDEGDEVVINSPVLVKPLDTEIFANSYHINFMGQNLGVREVDNDFFIADTTDTPGVDFAEVFFNMQKLCFNAAAGNYMIIGCLFAGYTEDNFQKGFRGKYERLCEKEFGAKFVNLRQYMITQAHLACGRTLSQEDKDMIKTGQLPPYLGDVHLNELGREITANLVAERCYELGWIKNKPNYYDVVATRIRLENDGTIKS